MIDENAFTTNAIFNVTESDFVALALKICAFQQENNAVYRSFCQNRPKPPGLNSIPFLPISFFKTHVVACSDGPFEKIFTSSGTTGMDISRHYQADPGIYETAFLRGFELFYGAPQQYAFLCLLPAYMEREGSSLIYMAERLAHASGQDDSGFFLKAEGELVRILTRREKAGQKSLLLGVSFALLDFAQQNPMLLANTIIMETGGMKGRRREMTRMELHETLQNAFGVAAIHSEYGMTELLSQAYSTGEGRYRCPPWMRVLVRDEDDPFRLQSEGAGILCIADLANWNTCSFIETADVGRVHPDGSFEVLGRMDNSDVRGCSLLVM
jgi:hypothetical protein